MSRPYSKRRGGFDLGGRGRGGGGGGGGAYGTFSNRAGNYNTNNANQGFQYSSPYGRRGQGGRHMSGNRGGSNNFRDRNAYKSNFYNTIRNNNYSNNSNSNINNNNNNSNNNNKAGRGNNASGDVMKTLLKLLFEKSMRQIFVEESGMLMLTNMRGSEDLSSAQNSVDFNSIAFCHVLADVIREVFANKLRILQVDNNKIRKLGTLLTALVEADIHHGIIAISARENNIVDFSFLSPLRHYDALGELLLTDNPVTKLDDYRTRIVQQVKQLKMLDGEVIEHNLLNLPNPIHSAAPDSHKMTVLMHLEQHLFHALDKRNFDHILQLYSPNASFSTSRFLDVLPSRIPLDVTHHSADLPKHYREAMQSELAAVRTSMQWRNLQGEVHSMRNIAVGADEVVRRLRQIWGERRTLHMKQELCPDANVCFLEVGVKVPICLLTVHGKLRFGYNPTEPGNPSREIFEKDKEPFIACFFDRTMSLSWDATTQTWKIENDMLFIRTDRVVVHDDGTHSQPLFFANHPHRLEQLRRRLLPALSTEVMAYIADNTTTDQQMSEIVQRLRSFPDEQQTELMNSVNEVKQILNMEEEQQEQEEHEGEENKLERT